LINPVFLSFILLNCSLDKLTRHYCRVLRSFVIETVPFRKLMFHILQFTDGIAVVCGSWISKENMDCLLPPSDISKHVKKKSRPDNSWERFKYEEDLLCHCKLGWK